MTMFSSFDPSTSAAPPPAMNGQYVTFTSAGACYGAEITSVQEIRSWQSTRPLPGRNMASRGVLDIRGNVVEIFDLGELLGAPALTAGAGSVILIVSLATRVIGLLVDSVSDIIQVSLDRLMDLPTDTRDVSAKWITAMVNHDGTLVGLLNLEALFLQH